ncbi:MAG TPA: LLM class flavin-dependent oxidoreductase [Pseudolysinimonas sp.]|nr:LLM class flavin-dependent oxidoreductase [Pseudolysinimonas sp.]
MTVPLSVLDLASVRDGSSHSEALADTLTVAREADRLGYRRFWVAEHHGMPGIASSSPPVLIGAIAAATERIRVGSGGVMLPNHSSLVVAEQFGTLVALHGDRIDLGLGRAAGTDPLVSATIRRHVGIETVDDFPQQVIELLAYFGTIPALEGGQGSRIMAVPGMGDAPELWLLGSSDFSARLAGMMGLPFAFAHHFAGGDATPLAFELYREAFTPSVVLNEPYSMVAVTALVADSAEQARELALPQALQMIRLRSGHPTRMPSLADTLAHPWTAGENAFVDQRLRHQAVGTVEHVQQRIDALVASTLADEVIVVPQGPTLEVRLNTLRSLAA